MHHAGGVFGEPLNLALDACADGRVQRGELGVGLAGYFDCVGHVKWRGFHGLNLPTKSSFRAARNSATSLGFWAVSQSCNSSKVSTDESTAAGISTVCVFTGFEWGKLFCAVAAAVHLRVRAALRCDWNELFAGCEKA